MNLFTVREFGEVETFQYLAVFGQVNNQVN